MGGVSRPGGQGSPDRWPGVKSLHVLCAEPKEHKHFRPGTRTGGSGTRTKMIGDRGDREIVYVPNVYVPFPAPQEHVTYIMFCFWNQLPEKLYFSYINIFQRAAEGGGKLRGVENIP